MTYTLGKLARGVGLIVLGSALTLGYQQLPGPERQHIAKFDRQKPCVVEVTNGDTTWYRSVPNETPTGDTYAVTTREVAGMVLGELENHLESKNSQNVRFLDGDLEIKVTFKH